MNKSNARCNTRSILSVVFLSSLMFLACARAAAADASLPLMAGGYDLVTYFQEQGPQPGNRKFSSTYEKHTLLFVSDENRKRFLTSPEKYMPAYGGNCSYGMVFGMKSKVDPTQYEIVDGRLHLLLDRGTLDRWKRRLDRNISKGDRAWKRLVASES